MKNVMKMSGLAITVILLAFLAGCSDLQDNKTAVTSATACTVSGNVFVGSQSGATTSALLSPAENPSARTATSSLSTTSLTFRTYAFKGTGIELNQSEVVNGIFDAANMTYSISLPTYGAWTVFVASSDSTLKGFTEVFVSEEYDALPNKDIALQPNFSTDETQLGSIELSIKDESEKLSKVTYSGTVFSTSSGNINSLQQTKSVSFTSGTATIALDDVKPNSYEVTFLFEDSKGNVLYKCKEAVNVFGGFKTDTWFGEGKHITKNQQTNLYEFVITDELISAYGTEIVPNTTLSQAYACAVDNSGNEYYLDAADSKKVIKSTKSSDWSITTAAPDTNSYNNKYLIAVDRATDTLWFYALYDSTMHFYGYKNISTTTPTEPDYNYIATAFHKDTTGNSEITLSVFDVYDGVFYVAGKSGNSSGYLVCVKPEECFDEGSDTNFTSRGSIDLKLPEAGLTNYPSINDILYQDGNVYLLVSELNTSIDENIPGDVSYCFISRGAVIRVNLWNKSVSAPMGLVTTPIDTSAGYMYAYYSSQDGHFFTSNTYTEENWLKVSCSSTNMNSYISGQTIAQTLPKLYAPSSAEDKTAFFGPQKFIAVKPKKLVIGDGGLAFFTDDNNGYRYKNANRDVEVDLESFAITDATSSGTQYSSYIGDLVGSGFTSIQSLGLSGSVYISNGSSWSNSSTENIAIGIPSKN
ncbi:MAG: hypothetical protein IJS09_10600 [Treponema sp.]|nr:hypothetical protein [Treponema sp.]